VPSAAQMALPEHTDAPPATSLRRRDLVRTVEFRQLFPAMVAGLAAGFAVNSNLKDLNPTGDLAAGATAVSVFAIANGAGRIAWGWIFDRMLPSLAIRSNLFSQALVLACCYLLVSDLPSLLIFAGLAGFNYGGVLVLYASTVARRWGLQHVGQVYGLLFAANIIASPAPVMAGLSLDFLSSFVPAFIALAILAAGTALRVTHLVNQKAVR